MFNGTIPRHPASIPWQDYRGAETGMIVYYGSDPVSELPIREVPEESPSDIIPEPNYETGTYGLYGCAKTKIRSTFVKSKHRCLFFMTKYAGANVDFEDALLITGFYHISQIADVQKLHIRYLSDYTCLSDDTCYALRADEAHFLSVDDAFALTPDLLKAWDCSTRVTRQTRIVLDEERTAELLEYIRSKPNVIDQYIEETRRLSPDADYDEDEEAEDEE
jgi:hypothetical protein